MPHHESAPSPREVWERAVARATSYDADGYAAAFANDGAVEFPFGPPGRPKRVIGRDAIRALMRGFAGAADASGRRIVRIEPVVVHDTNDPEVVVVEFDLHGASADGETYTLSYVHVVRARDGEIVSLRDYFDAFAMTPRTGSVAANDATP